MLILLPLLSCDDQNDVSNKKINYSKDSSFVIYKDTFDFKHEGELEQVAYFDNKYFCVINHSDKKLIILDEEGTYTNEVLTPKAIENTSYYDLVIENDSLFLKLKEGDEENFVLVNNNTEFQPIEKRNFKIFEDDEYNIYANCHGEWGGALYFQNKKTKEKYEAESTCAIIVNKIKNEYYVTNALRHMGVYSNVSKISDPEKLEKSNWDFDELIQGGSWKGVEDLYTKRLLFLSTSFVINNELLHLCKDIPLQAKNDTNSKYIAKIENDTLKPIYTFDFQFELLFNQQIGGKKQILTFKERKDNKEGILLIDSNVFTFKYFR